MERDGFILDREPGYFTEYSAEELLATGCTEEQLPGIRECLAKRGLYLKGEAEAKAEPAADDEPAASKPERKR